ncbi:helix-turn-helix domain-containing protein, partial [Bacillus subtilis]
MDPGDIKTREEFEAAIRALHKASGLSYNKAAAACGVAQATIHDMVTGKRFPRWQTLAELLPVWNVDPADHDRWRQAHSRAIDDDDGRLGRQLDKIDDPFLLDVHRPISVDALHEPDPLPPYVKRAHDTELAALVDGAREGRSAMAVLVAGSSAGKTRALWEALTPLRAMGGWRLWKPPQESANSDVRRQLANVGRRTVLWLNETQNYLGDVAGDPQHMAQQIQEMLADPSLAPVLVLGPLWPDHHRDLSRNSTSRVSKLLENTAIRVPDAFTEKEVDAILAATEQDPRLRMASMHAEDGHITQYLAGGPELLRRYLYSASPAARAVIEVAMDARRLGHRNALPWMLLCEGAPYYMSDDDWNSLEDNWFEQALADLGTSCKGAPGPITRIRPRPPLKRTTGHTLHGPNQHELASDQPIFQLADYLDQYGRKHRADTIPPSGFWAAVTRHAHSEDQSA